MTNIVCIYEYVHVSDCTEIVFELLLLPNNTATETFLQISEAMGSVNRIFVNKTPAWRSLGE